MNETVATALKKQAETFELKSFDENDPDKVWELLNELPSIHEEIVSRHRWYNSIFKVVKIGDVLIGYYDAETTGDMSAQDMGISFYLDSVCECEEFTTVSYRPKGLS